MLRPEWCNFHSKRRFREKVVNTFLQVHWLWPLVFRRDQCYARAMAWNDRSLVLRIVRYALLRIFWFWPRLSGAQIWVCESHEGGMYDPQKFSRIDAVAEVLVDEVVAQAESRNGRILDLGCNCGRFLDALLRQGFADLAGVDISQRALEYMATAFPDLAGKVEVTCASFQQYLTGCPDRSFDLVFSRGATVELVHPSFPVIRQLCRVTRECIILLFNENGHAYPRFWTYEFLRGGFILTKLQRMPSSEVAHTLMVLHRIRD